jgi:hypothetical protein
MTNFIFIFELAPALGIVKPSILTNFVKEKNFGKKIFIPIFISNNSFI